MAAADRAGAVSVGWAAPAVSADPVSTRARRKIRAAVLERDGWICQRCGAPATDAGHLVAESHGGPYTPDNLQAECTRCNRGDGQAIAASLVPTPADWCW